MRRDADIPSVPLDATLSTAVLEISRKRMGMTAVVGRDGRIAGIFTDGDLRRTVEKVADLKTARIAELMSKSPRVVDPNALAVEAVELMERHKINQLLVAGEDGLLVGALDMHDLFRAKVV
jgi:arabinose-5-phosphate isomerase